jgi:hypothetical protein
VPDGGFELARQVEIESRTGYDEGWGSFLGRLAEAIATGA